MAKVTVDQVSVERRSKEVALKVPVDGRARNVILPAKDAISIGIRLMNTGVDALDHPINVQHVTGLHLRPFQSGEPALLSLTLENGTTAIFAVADDMLRGLASSATAALEFAEVGGSA